MLGFKSYEATQGAVNTKPLSYFGTALDNMDAVIGAAEIDGSNNRLKFFGVDVKIGNAYLTGSLLVQSDFSNIGEGNILTPDTINAIGGNVLGSWTDSDGSWYGLILRKYDDGTYKYQRMQYEGKECIAFLSHDLSQGVNLNQWEVIEAANGAFVRPSEKQTITELSSAFDIIPALTWFDNDNRVYINGYLAPWSVSGKNARIAAAVSVTAADLTAAQASGDFVPLNYN